MPKACARMELIGMKELEKQLDSAGERVRAKVLPPALRAGAKPIVLDARHRVRKVSGATRKSLGVAIRQNRRYKKAAAIIGPRRGFMVKVGGRKHDPANVAHCVEGGHGAAGATRKTAGGEKRLSLRQARSSSWREKILRTSKNLQKHEREFKGKGGAAPARPFLKPAFEAKKAEALEAIKGKIAEGLHKELGVGH